MATEKRCVAEDRRGQIRKVATSTLLLLCRPQSPPNADAPLSTGSQGLGVGVGHTDQLSPPSLEHSVADHSSSSRNFCMYQGSTEAEGWLLAHLLGHSLLHSKMRSFEEWQNCAGGILSWGHMVSYFYSQRDRIGYWPLPPAQHLPLADKSQQGYEGRLQRRRRKEGRGGERGRGGGRGSPA